MNRTEVYRPELLKPSVPEDRERLKVLRAADNVQVLDLLEDQITELLLCRNPQKSAKQLKEENELERYKQKCEEEGKDIGNWVYYPWAERLVHILTEEEFIEVRTNRNREKITREEQAELRKKRVGIVGLSVGRAVALCLATERIAGSFYLADFDSIELSNLNRITGGLQELGQNKSISAARAIAELDPYLEVKCFTEGLTDDNIDQFLDDGRKLDIFVEECDDIYIKIQSRLACRKLGIPVIMETNDRCQIDIERFDLEPNRPIFHGKVTNYTDIKRDLTMEEKVQFLSQIIDIDAVSEGMKRSMPGFGTQTRSWPQLASEIYLGAGFVSNYIQNILFKGDIESGCFIQLS
ncbi:hypothetical protein GYB22_07265 [bacterium]|nr:hypothetical protein [bacterium]